MLTNRTKWAQLADQRFVAHNHLKIAYAAAGYLVGCLELDDKDDNGKLQYIADAIVDSYYPAFCQLTQYVPLSRLAWSQQDQLP